MVLLLLRTLELRCAPVECGEELVHVGTARILWGGAARLVVLCAAAPYSAQKTIQQRNLRQQEMQKALFRGSVLLLLLLLLQGQAVAVGAHLPDEASARPGP